jgi:choice-of-anchor B domain-containing protein
MKKLVITLLFSLSYYSVISQNRNMDLQSQFLFSNSGTSGIWGYIDTTGREYALVGLKGSAANNSACAIVDVTDPVNPVLKFNIAGPNSNWREIRTWQNYAYITTEASGGVTIVDLGSLPDTIYTKQYTGNDSIAGMLNTVHALHIDQGKLYLYGTNMDGGKAKVFSLSDPWTPVFIGTASTLYAHDGYVKNDTVYSCAISNGLMEIIDARNPSNPIVINTQNTPGGVTHNSWLSSDYKTVYVTDESDGSFVLSYDISDMGNIKELDRYRRFDHKNAIAHNVYVLKDSAVTGTHSDYVITAYNSEGITIADATFPDNLIEVANYDCSPFSGGGFHGAWGAYVFLPSGNLLVSDRVEGLFVLKPEYKRACYLEGLITDSLIGIGLHGVSIKNNSILLNEESKIDGTYQTGSVDTGIFQIEFSKAGYFSKTIPVHLQTGIINTLNVQLVPGNNGISKTDDIEFDVSPNPLTNTSVISYDLHSIALNNATIELINILGEQLEKYSVEQTKGQIQLRSDLEKGIYLIRFTNGHVIKTVKIVK